MRRTLLVTIIVTGLACGREVPTESAGSTGPAVAVTSMAPVTHSVVVDPSPGTGVSGSLVSGPGGRQEITYYDFTYQDLKYATCPASCTVAANWKTGLLDQATTQVGGQSSLKVGSDGRRFVTYWEYDQGDLKYATCAPAADCTVTANWVKTRPDPGREVVGLPSSLALGPDGSLNVSYRWERYQTHTGSPYTELKYATCRTRCGSSISWTKLVIDPGEVGDYISLAVGSNGRRHIAYSGGNQDLRYATCPASCTTAANWQKITVDQTGLVGDGTSLAIGRDGVLHISYYDLTKGKLKYARCAANCSAAAGWQTATVRSTGKLGGGLYTSIAAGSAGRVYVSYYNAGGSALYYVTCAASCTQAASWTGALLDGAFSDAGRWNSLALAGNQVHVSYYDIPNDGTFEGRLKYLERTP